MCFSCAEIICAPFCPVFWGERTERTRRLRASPPRPRITKLEPASTRKEHWLNRFHAPPDSNVHMEGIYSVPQTGFRCLPLLSICFVIEKKENPDKRANSWSAMSIRRGEYILLDTVEISVARRFEWSPRLFRTSKTDDSRFGFDFVLGTGLRKLQFFWLLRRQYLH